jgi:hypothetical protein
MAIGPAHGVELAYEPVDALGTWVVIAHLTDDINLVYTDEAQEALEHNIDGKTYYDTGMTTVEEIPVPLNYDPADPTHVTLRNYFHTKPKTRFRLRMRGRNGTANSDETIFNDGFLTRWEDNNPIGGPTRKVISSYRPSGTYTLDGVTFAA